VNAFALGELGVGFVEVVDKVPDVEDWALVAHDKQTVCKHSKK
jgi:hypothetical protein